MFEKQFQKVACQVKKLETIVDKLVVFKMSSLRVVLGSSLSSAVKNGGRLGLTSAVTAPPKWWLSSYTLSKHFHSFHHHQSTFPVADRSLFGSQLSAEFHASSSK